MDLRRLEVFVKVAELGSFSRAAEALFRTRPTVSEHVRALEDALGVLLLDRLGRTTRPTRAGARTRSPLAQAFLTFVESHLAARPS